MAVTEEDSDEIDIEGTQEYFGALGLGLEDVLVLPLCYYLKAPSMGKFSRDGFIKGWFLLDKADTIARQKEVLTKLREEFEQNKPIRLDAEQIAAKAAAEAAAKYDSYGYYGSSSSKISCPQLYVRKFVKGELLVIKWVFDPI